MAPHGACGGVDRSVAANRSKAPPIGFEPITLGSECRFPNGVNDKVGDELQQLNNCVCSDVRRNSPHGLAANDKECQENLGAVISAWPTLPPSIQAAIMTLIAACSSGSELLDHELKGLGGNSLGPSWNAGEQRHLSRLWSGFDVESVHARGRKQRMRLDFFESA